MMKYTLYITGALLWIIGGLDSQELLLVIGWIIFIGGVIVDRIDRLEEKITKK